MVELCIVGGGNMGPALVDGLLRAGRDPESMVVVAPSLQRREELGSRWPNGPVLVADPPVSEGAVIAVKPDKVEAACRAVGEAGCERLLSIAAGVRIEDLESWVGPDVRVVRSMPNTPAQVSFGAAAISPGTTATEDDLEWAEEILGSVGIVVRVDEPSLDAVTGLSGSGPAYVFKLVEAMAAAGEKVGLGAETSQSLARQTVIGAARLLEAQPEKSPKELREAVTSPNGTTEAGLAALQAAGFNQDILAAVRSAAARSRELGGEQLGPRAVSPGRRGRAG